MRIDVRPSLIRFTACLEYRYAGVDMREIGAGLG
jgi:hypothetical protein